MMKYFFFLLLCNSLFSLQAQSKGDLRVEIERLKAQNAELKEEISALKGKIVNKEIIERTLKAEVSLISDSLEIVRNSVLSNSKIQRSESSKKDSLQLASLEELAKLYQAKLGKNAVEENLGDKQRVFDRPGCSHCVKFQNFQSLFIEVAFIEYEIFPATNTFTGFYKYKYVPEFGELDFKVKRIAGTYVISKNTRILNLNKIDDELVALTLEHNLEKPKNSSISGNGLQVHKLYTKEASLLKMDMLECY